MVDDVHRPGNVPVPGGAGMLMIDDLAGLDLEAFARWYATARPDDLRAPLRGLRIGGGKSNLTYLVSDGRCSRIVRRPPLGHVQDTAHNMEREHAVMEALADTGVPVPEMFAVCTDPHVLGAPFFVMEQAPGTAYRTAEQLRSLGPGRTAAIVHSMMDALAGLHQIEPATVGLAEFGRPHGFLARQVRRWARQLEGSRSRALPDADRLVARLTSATTTASPDPTGAIVHGDYRLDNILISDTDRIVAVIDWEMATLGDPLTDLALLAVYHHLPSLTASASVATASLAPGYPTVEDMFARYERTVDRPIGPIDVHLGLAYFKLAVILEGIHYRHLQGQTVGDGFDHVGDSVPLLLATGLNVTRSLTRSRPRPDPTQRFSQRSTRPGTHIGEQRDGPDPDQ